MATTDGLYVCMPKRVAASQLAASVLKDIACAHTDIPLPLQVPERLAGWASSSSALSAWLSRFSSLRRPLDGSTPLAEVLAAGGDVVSGILTAKGAAQAAQAAAQAAKQAHASAEQVGLPA